MSEIAAADERALLDQLRRLQDAHHRGDQAAASAMPAALFDRYGRETVAAVRWRQAAGPTSPCADGRQASAIPKSMCCVAP
ncbi:hypothetical protein [Nocardia farcinica]